ncbi:MAG: deoxynucleoside kinase [Candidatus Aenigmarchaeota archaeon]|nr:deoxynucleoside kinase [Candidatus Aenigmarchaeota archaeon]
MYVTISGVHGIGKSSICNLLVKRNKWELLPEILDVTVPPPVFGPKSEHKLLTQLWFMRQMIVRENKIRSSPDPIILCDRGWHDVLIYSKVLLNNNEFNIFQSVISAIPKKFPELEIILWTDTEKIIERIKARNRDNLGSWGEDDLEYLKNVNELYKEYYDDFKDIKNIILIDASGTLEETYSKVRVAIDNSMR